MILLDQFDTLIETPEAVEQLRRLVLDLAVRGRLVPQDPDDEPASVLLDEIAAEKARLHEAGEISSPKQYSSLAEANQPYSLPACWVWTRLGVVRHGCGQTTPAAPFSYIDVSAIDKERGVIGVGVETLEPEDAPSRARKRVRPGTVLYSTVRPNLLNVAIVDRDFDPPPIASTAFAIVHPFTGVDPRYLYYYLRSRPMIAFVESKMVGLAYPAISDAKLYQAPLPLPPKAEQLRIVARVDELMTLCDRLSDQIADRDTHRRRWATSTVRHISDDEAIGSVSAWDFAEARFDALVVTPEIVPHLRRLVRDLAVHGKLTQQDENDEPAAALLQRAEAEKQRLYKAGEIRKPKKLSPISEGEKRFEVPHGWAWARVDAMSEQIIDCLHKTPKFEEKNTGYYCIDTTCLAYGSVEMSKMRYVSAETYVEWIQRLRPKGGDVLFSREGQIGLTALVPFGVNACIGQRTMLFRPHAGIDPRYFLLLLLSPIMVSQWKASVMGTAAPHVNIGAIRQFVVPLPPVAEQIRIVEQADRLTALCNQVEANLKEKNHNAERLMRAVLKDALAGPSASEAAA